MPESIEGSKASPRLLMIDDYVALRDAGDDRRTELIRGVLVMVPSPGVGHMVASGDLCFQLKTQLPMGLEAILSIDVNLELPGSNRGGTVRRPDLIIVDRETTKRTEAENRLVRASEVLLIVEIISPGSVKTDLVTKHHEYAEAGIRHYWMLDLKRRPSLVAAHLAGEFGYRDEPAVTGTYETTEPAPLKIDLDDLV